MALTLANIFGTNAVYDQNTRQLKIFIDDLANHDEDFGIGDFTNGLGMNTGLIDASNANSYAEKILWALIQLTKQNQPTTNNDETVGIYITNQGKRNLNRNGVAQLGFQELVTGYKDDPSGLVLDPDDVGTASV